MIDTLLAKKRLQDLSKDASDMTQGLKRVLGPWHLIFFGTDAIIRELVSIGALFAFVIVCSDVLGLRKSKLRHNSNRIE